MKSGFHNSENPVSFHSSGIGADWPGKYNRTAMGLKSPQMANVGLTFGLCAGTAAGVPALRFLGCFPV